MPSGAATARPLPRPFVVAHRGASTEAVDNSLDAFERAIVAGADVIELDVRRTRDGEIVAFHDDVVGGRHVAELSAAEIGERTGHVPPRLRDVLALAEGRIALDVELKEDGYVGGVLRLLAASFTGRVIVTSFLEAVVGQVARLRPDLAVGLVVELCDEAAVRRALRCGAHYLLPAVRPETAIEAPVAAGLGVLLWTVNDDDQLRVWLADPRLHAVITDRPARALELRR